MIFSFPLLHNARTKTLETPKVLSIKKNKHYIYDLLFKNKKK